MAELENFKLLGIALAIGLLVGLERGWEMRDRDEGTRVAGIRTYGLIALLGGIWALIAVQVDPTLMGFAFLSLTLVTLTAYYKSLAKIEDFGITSIIASLITFVLGALTVFGHVALASATAVVIALLLGFKPLLHGWLKKLEQRELYATLKLLLISVVMLPILPNRDFGPWGVFNAYHIWLMVVLIAAISYMGYFAIKIAGHRHGPVLTGVFGGLASSTAVTLNLSRFSKQYPGLENALAAGILTACATMFPRTLLLASIFNAELLQSLLPTLTAMSLFCYLAAYLFWRTAPEETKTEHKVILENPFQLGIALKFGALLLAILFMARLLQAYFGAAGTYLLSALSGITDVDPITLSMAKMSSDGLNLQVAMHAVVIAVSVNSVVKGIISLVIGGRSVGVRVAGTLIATVGIGLLTILLL
ncbi:MAG: MgtC/SapB family protein [Gammaproteobacteria bacterium]